MERHTSRGTGILRENYTPESFSICTDGQIFCFQIINLKSGNLESPHTIPPLSFGIQANENMIVRVLKGLLFHGYLQD